MDSDFGDVIHLQFTYSLFLFQSIDIAAVVDAAYQTLCFESSLTDYIFIPYGSWALVEPANIQRNILFDTWLLFVCLHNRIATRNVDVIIQGQRYAHW